MADSVFDRLKNNTVLNASMLITACFPARAAVAQQPSTGDRPLPAASETLDARQIASPEYKQGVRDGLKLGRELAKIEAFVDYLEMNAQQTNKLVESTRSPLVKDWREDYKVINEDISAVRESLNSGHLDSLTIKRLMNRVGRDLNYWNLEIIKNNRSSEVPRTANNTQRTDNSREARVPFAIPPAAVQGDGVMIGIYNPVELRMYSKYVEPLLDKMYPQIEDLMDEVINPSGRYNGNRGLGHDIRDRMMREVEQNERDGKTMKPRR